MKAKLLFVFSFVVFIAQAQQTFIAGHVVNDNGDNMPATLVINSRTNEKTFADNLGHFTIAAQNYDELRFVRGGYDVQYIKLSRKELDHPIVVTLQKPAVDIQEIKIAFNPTGNLKKDIAYFRTSPKASKLNAQMRQYLKYQPAETTPANTIPSAFKPYDYSAGQISLISFGPGANGGLIGLIGQSIFSKNQSNNTITAAESNDFYKKIKAAVDVNYFTGYGLDEYDFEIFLIYADKKLALSKKYARNFDKDSIEFDLKIALKDFLRVYKTAT